MATIKIKRGDTLEKLARRYGTSVAALAAANGISDPNRIKAGASLVLPADATLGVAPPVPMARPAALSVPPPALQTLAPPPMASAIPLPVAGRPEAPVGSMPRALPPMVAGPPQVPAGSLPGTPPSMVASRPDAPVGAMPAAPNGMDALKAALANIPGASMVYDGRDAAGFNSALGSTDDVPVPPRTASEQELADAKAYLASQLPSTDAPSSWYGMGPTPGTEGYNGDKTMVTVQPLPSSATLKPDALVNAARDAGQIPGLASILPNGMIWPSMANQIGDALPPGVTLDPKTNKISISPDMLSKIDKSLGTMGPLGEFGRSVLTNPNGALSEYAALDVPPSQTFPLPVPRPTAPAPLAPTPIQPTLPQTSLVDAQPPSSGLTSRSVTTVPIGPDGQPVLAATAEQAAAPPDYESNPAYQFVSGLLGPPGQWNPEGKSLPQQADEFLTNTFGNGDPNYAPNYSPPSSVQTAEAAPTVAPVYDPFGTNDPNKDQTQQVASNPSVGFDPASPTIQKPYNVPYAGSGNNDLYPFPPLTPTTTQPKAPPLEITIPGKGTPLDVTGTQSTAVGTDLDVSPLPDDSPTYTPGFTPPMVTPPMVKIASGKTVPVGTLGTAQGGKYDYQVKADGSIWTGGRMSSPPTVMGPPMSPAPSVPQTDMQSMIDTIERNKSLPRAGGDPTRGSANGFFDFLSRTPAGHVYQALTGQPVEGGVLKAIGVNSGNTGTTAPPPQNNGIGTYWDPRSGSWVTP